MLTISESHEHEFKMLLKASAKRMLCRFETTSYHTQVWSTEIFFNMPASVYMPLCGAAGFPLYVYIN
jgi:hypothetical protein